MAFEVLYDVAPAFRLSFRFRVVPGLTAHWLREVKPAPRLQLTHLSPQSNNPHSISPPPTHSVHLEIPQAAALSMLSSAQTARSALLPRNSQLDRHQSPFVVVCVQQGRSRGIGITYNNPSFQATCRKLPQSAPVNGKNGKDDSNNQTGALDENFDVNLPCIRNLLSSIQKLS